MVEALPGRPEAFRPKRIGRRVFLSMVAVGAAGVAFGARIQQFVSNAIGSGLGGLVPGGDRFRIYTITGGFPVVSREDYRLQIMGLVEHPVTLTLDDIESMPRTTLVKDFQCVTGWRVTNVQWEGVKLSDILERVHVSPEAKALAFESYDRADTESLTLEQARLPDVLVAHRMLGAPITTEHGGPVRLYVAPMFGYKSIKWLSVIRVTDGVEPGFWEQNGYPVNGWIDGSTSDSVAGNDTTTLG